MQDIVVIGIGNTIKSDDGAGVRALEMLEPLVGDDVELVEGRVYCADMLPVLEGRRKAIFIDGIDSGEEPGAIFRFSPDEVKSEKKISLSIHDFGVYDLIMAARLLEQCPEELVMFCVQVKDTSVGQELSPEVEAALPRLCELVLEEVGGRPAATGG
jgi:hydrogenase maturation protease